LGLAFGGLDFGFRVEGVGTRGLGIWPESIRERVGGFKI